MDDRLIVLLASDKGLNISRRQAAVWIQLLAGNGIVSGNADALRNIEIQDEIVMKIEVVDKSWILISKSSFCAYNQ